MKWLIQFHMKYWIEQLLTSRDRRVYGLYQERSKRTKRRSNTGW